MTHEDTERFLEQLSQAWPRDAERDAMLDELRDHLLAIEEDESLDADEREQTLLAALAECGDARRLANKLRGEVQQRKWRWIMRVSTAAAVAGIATLLGIATYWPSPNAVPIAAVAIAQQPGLASGLEPGSGPGAGPGAGLGPGAVGGPGMAVGIAGGQDANNQKTQAKLAERLEARFVDLPFQEAIDFLSDKTGIETYLNRRALEEAGVALETPVNVQLKQVRGDMLLDLILQQVGSDEIDYVVRDGIVVITSVASLDGANEVKAYPVADLLRLHQADGRGVSGMMGGGSESGFPGAGSATPGVSGGMPAGMASGPGGGFGGPVEMGSRDLPPEVQQLVKVLQNSVSPDSWIDMGGHGSITYYGEMLIVRQNARTHREIEKVLTMLRETAARRPGKHG